jgi:dolichol-phosphate mannosyltransferase
VFTTFLIPCFNERDALPKLFDDLRRLPALLAPRFPEVVFVDDGSTDGTVETLQDFAADVLFPCRVLGLDQNRGVGAAIREGAALVAGEAVVLYDADRAYPIEDAVRLLDALERGADVATATPFGEGAAYEESAPYRRFFSAAAATAYRARLLFRTSGVRCFTCGFRAWRREWFLRCLPSRDGFPSTAEALLSAFKKGARVVELPSRLRKREAGFSKMKLKKALVGHAGLLLFGPAVKGPGENA